MHDNQKKVTEVMTGSNCFTNFDIKVPERQVKTKFFSHYLIEGIFNAKKSHIWNGFKQV